MWQFEAVGIYGINFMRHNCSNSFAIENSKSSCVEYSYFYALKFDFPDCHRWAWRFYLLNNKISILFKKNPNYNLLKNNTKIYLIEMVGVLILQACIIERHIAAHPACVSVCVQRFSKYFVLGLTQLCRANQKKFNTVA